MLIDTGVVVEWEDLEIRIIRPNLECTNGFIHVIDQVIHRYTKTLKEVAFYKIPTMSAKVLIALHLFR